LEKIASSFAAADAGTGNAHVSGADSGCGGPAAITPACYAQLTHWCCYELSSHFP